MTREERTTKDKLDLKDNVMFLQQVHDFKYSRVSINNRNCMHNEIEQCLKAGNKCYFVLSHIMFKSKLLSRKKK